MTDKELIQALDEWRKAIKDDYKRLQLLDAPMDCFEESHTVNFLLLSNAIDLINRQQAENEKLIDVKFRYEILQKNYNEIEQQLHYLSNVEIPYLYSFTEDKDKKLETLANILLGARAKAIKEFAERLDRKFAFYYSDTQCISAKTIRESIRNELKETVGEENV